MMLQNGMQQEECKIPEKFDFQEEPNDKNFVFVIRYDISERKKV